MAASRLHQAVAPAYLFLCLILGGSAQGVWSNLALQIIAVALLAWAAWTSDAEPVGAAGRRLIWIFSITLLLIGIQLIPLPPQIWGQLPGRSIVRDGYAILGMQSPWLPMTMAADETWLTVLRLLPAAAVLAIMIRLNAYRLSWIAGAVVAGAVCGILLGALQVTGEAGPNSPYYFYRRSNFGAATGFFANSNHMASLLVVTVPFLFAMLAANQSGTSRDRLQRRTAAYFLVGIALVLTLLGLALNGSLAGFGLIIPVIAASALLLVGWRRQRRWLAIPALLLVAAIIGGLALPIGGREDPLGATASVETRGEITAKSWDAGKQYFPFGSGLGTFEKVYRLQEDPTAVDRVYVNHAHNDYLELIVELGLPGLILIAGFLAWWVTTAAKRWRDNLGDLYGKAAIIASAALLAHSLVDFPLRTPALSVLFAATLALISSGNRSPAVGRADLRPTRHLEIR